MAHILPDKPLEDRVAALEAIVAHLAPEPDFMASTRTEPLPGPVLTVRLVHEPTGVTVDAPGRAEAVLKLRKALAGRARRHHDLQERERRRQAAEQAPGAA